MREYSSDIYSKEALLKAANAFTDVWYIHLGCEGNVYTVSIRSKESLEEINEERSFCSFENELIAQQTRFIVSSRTKNLREMIVARALSSTMITNLPDEVFDGSDAEDVMKDWFNE